MTMDIGEPLRDEAGPAPEPPPLVGPRRPRRRGRTVLIAVVVVAILAGLGFALRALLAPPPAPSRTLTVTRGDLIETAVASGTIEPHVQVEIKSRAPGEVIEVLVAEGEVVEAGQVLVRLDPTDAARGLREAEVAERRAEADLAMSRASLGVSQQELGQAGANQEVRDRGAELGLISREEQRTAGHSARVAGGTVSMRRAQAMASAAALDAARLGVENARRRLTEMEVRAPVSGTILSVAVERGSLVSSATTSVTGGTTLATIADLADLRVIGAIDEAQIARVAVGQEVVIRVNAYPAREFAGRVSRVSPLGVLTTSIVTFDVEITVTDPNATRLRSGMSADLEIVTARRGGVLRVPLVALHSRGTERFVYLLSGVERRIQTGATDGAHIEVLEGLEDGDVLDLTPRTVEVLGATPFDIGPRGRKRR